MSTLDGSPIDRLFYLGMIIASLNVLSKRRLEVGALISRNWPLLLFYGFLLLSVTWANSPFSSFKRWLKEIGNISVALVILTEANPSQALRAVFVRCAIVFIPLSMIFIRWIPHLGRFYSRNGGMQSVGVTCQKNSLGIMVLIFGLILLWDWLERSRPGQPRRDSIDRITLLGLGLIGAWLIYLSDSKTSMVCLALGALIIAGVRLPVLRNRIQAFGAYFVVGAVAFYFVDSSIGLTEWIVTSLGRDMTFTGRTEVWDELLALRTDPLLGTGFLSLWDDMRYRSILPEWVGGSAHNGYLEIYLAGGFVGIGVLAITLLAVGFKINEALKRGGNYAVVRFAFFVVMLISNLTESHFACMTPVGFLFLLAAIGHAHPPSPLPESFVSEPDATAFDPVARDLDTTKVSSMPSQT
jgi:exopolysaccharide production protein ExoQ